MPYNLFDFKSLLHELNSMNYLTQKNTCFARELTLYLNN